MNNTNDLYGSEYDSEDDEGFFLTPVLHYDISSKIKEANKILFEENEQKKSNPMDEKVGAMEANRRVTFSKELVSYAPQVQLETITTSEDEEEISIKEELESLTTTTTTTITTIEKIIELNEIINEIGNEIIMEQENKTTTVESKKKSVLELDPPLHKQQENKEIDVEEEPIATTTAVEESVDKKLESLVDSEEESDTLSIQVGVIARKQIRQEIKEQKMKSAPSPKVKKCHPKREQKEKKVSTPKFNYKICCEYQQACRLPQYKGYISEYGLTLRERERMLKIQKRQERNLLEHETRIQNESMHRLTANEKAFSAWLNNKCRNAPNRTRNMFDFPKLTKKRKTTKPNST